MTPLVVSKLPVNSTASAKYAQIAARDHILVYRSELPRYGSVAIIYNVAPQSIAVSYQTNGSLKGGYGEVDSSTHSALQDSTALLNCAGMSAANENTGGQLLLLFLFSPTQHHPFCD